MNTHSHQRIIYLVFLLLQTVLSQFVSILVDAAKQLKFKKHIYFIFSFARSFPLSLFFIFFFVSIQSQNVVVCLPRMKRKNNQTENGDEKAIMVNSLFLDHHIYIFAFFSSFFFFLFEHFLSLKYLNKNLIKFFRFSYIYLN